MNVQINSKGNADLWCQINGKCDAEQESYRGPTGCRTWIKPPTANHSTEQFPHDKTQMQTANFIGRFKITWVVVWAMLPRDSHRISNNFFDLQTQVLCCQFFWGQVLHAPTGMAASYPWSRFMVTMVTTSYLPMAGLPWLPALNVMATIISYPWSRSQWHGCQSMHGYHGCMPLLVAFSTEWCLFINWVIWLWIDACGASVVDNAPIKTWLNLKLVWWKRILFAWHFN